jgi:hypothetical protein
MIHTVMKGRLNRKSLMACDLVFDSVLTQPAGNLGMYDDKWVFY